MNPATSEFAGPLIKQVLAIPRYGRAEEIALMVAYVAGPEAAYVTGASLTIDGGFNAKHLWHSGRNARQDGRVRR